MSPESRPGAGPPAPYPGLRAFRRDEAELFFGRDEQVDQLLDKLAGHRFLAVLGSSGSGKSSLVRAGLLPALDSGLLLRRGSGAGPWPGSRWSIAELRPGEQPFRRLAEALLADGHVGNGAGNDAGNGGWDRVLAARHAHAADPIAALEADLHRGDQALAWLPGVAPLPPGERLLILVDQFEELFRFHDADSAQATAFVALLLAGIAHPDCHVVVTLRSELLGPCARFPDRPEAINAGLFLTPRPRPAQIVDAIELPPCLPGFDGEVSPALVRALLGAAAFEQDRLPLLQHLLLQLWQRTPADADGRRVLDTGGLAAIGGADGALDRDADDAYAELDAAGQAVAAALFRALTAPGAGGEPVRRPATVAEVAAGAGCTPEAVIAAAEPFRRDGPF